jgi:hypothetical protein
MLKSFLWGFESLLTGSKLAFNSVFIQGNISLLQTLKPNTQKAAQKQQNKIFFKQPTSPV